MRFENVDWIQLAQERVYLQKQSGVNIRIIHKLKESGVITSYKTSLAEKKRWSEYQLLKKRWSEYQLLKKKVE
jgi:hypothetical protein